MSPSDKRGQSVPVGDKFLDSRRLAEALREGPAGGWQADRRSHLRIGGPTGGVCVLAGFSAFDLVGGGLSSFAISLRWLAFSVDRDC